MHPKIEPLKVAFIVGGLTQGGAEKQLLYMARTLHQSGVDVRVYCLTKGDPYEKDLINAGITPLWIGSASNPLFRLVKLVRLLRKDRPHFIQSTHFFTNLYAGIAARFTGSISIGSIRSDPEREVRANGRWGRWLLRLPAVLLANSETAREKASRMGVRLGSVYSLPNVIALDEYPRVIRQTEQTPEDGSLRLISVARLVPVKRFDRFMEALALARRKNPRIRGVIVGDGPEMQKYQTLADHLGLLPDGMQFAWMQANVPDWLAKADAFLLTSDQEGFPNVLLEAMAAGLPVLTTPAGDAGYVVQDGVTGYVVAMDDMEGLAARFLELADNPALRAQFGAAGRRRVEALYSFECLGGQMIELYQATAQDLKHQPALRALSHFTEAGLASEHGSTG